MCLFQGFLKKQHQSYARYGADPQRFYETKFRVTPRASRALRAWRFLHTDHVNVHIISKTGGEKSRVIKIIWFKIAGGRAFHFVNIFYFVEVTQENQWETKKINFYLSFRSDFDLIEKENVKRSTFNHSC